MRSKRAHGSRMREQATRARSASEKRRERAAANDSVRGVAVGRSPPEVFQSVAGSSDDRSRCRALRPHQAHLQCSSLAAVTVAAASPHGFDHEWHRTKGSPAARAPASRSHQRDGTAGADRAVRTERMTETGKRRCHERRVMQRVEHGPDGDEREAERSRADRP
jgi:hypothetical protein